MYQCDVRKKPLLFFIRSVQKHYYVLFVELELEEVFIPSGSFSITKYWILSLNFGKLSMLKFKDFLAPLCENLDSVMINLSTCSFKILNLTSSIKSSE